MNNLCIMLEFLAVHLIIIVIIVTDMCISAKIHRTVR
jgi:hypothetical protein